MLSRRRFLDRTLAVLSTATCTRAWAEAPGSKLLREHRLADVRFRKARLSYPRPVGRNARKGHHGQVKQATVCILETDQGATGWGLIRDRIDCDLV